MPSLPSGLQFGSVTGKIYFAGIDIIGDSDSDPEAIPATGTVTFTPSVQYVVDAGNKVIIPLKKFTVTLNAGMIRDPDGNFYLRLPASDSAGIAPTGFTYTVDFQLNEGQLPSFNIEVKTGQVVDISGSIGVVAKYGTVTLMPDTVVANYYTKAQVDTLLLGAGSVDQSDIDAAIATEVANRNTAIASEATARNTAISTAIANLVNTAPSTLDTLNELATALGNDPNFATTIATTLAGKQPLAAELTALAGRAPSYAPSSRINRYDNLLSLYNAKEGNLRKLRASLARVASGGSGCWVAVGDSRTAGYVGASNGVIVGGSPSGFDRLNAWPRVLAGALNQAGIPAASSGMQRIQDCNFTNTAFTLSAGWITGNFTYAYTTAANETIDWTTDQAGTKVTVYVIASNGGFTVSVDGALSGTGFATYVASSASGVYRVTLTGLSDRVHTVRLKTNSTGFVFAVAMECGYPTGLAIHNVGQSASSAYNAPGNTTSLSAWTYGDAISGLAAVYGPNLYGVTPDVVFCSLGVNDKQINGYTDAQIVSALQRIRQTTYPNSDFVLVQESRPGGWGQTLWETYIGQCYLLADTLDVPLLDSHARTGGYSVESVNGLTGDTTAHLNVVGYNDLGQSVAAAVLQGSGAGTSRTFLSQMLLNVGPFMMQMGWRVHLYYDGTSWPARTVPYGYSGEVWWHSEPYAGAPPPPGALDTDEWVGHL